VRLLSEHDEQQITDALDRVYAHESSALDPALASMQVASLVREQW